MGMVTGHKSRMQAHITLHITTNQIEVFGEDYDLFRDAIGKDNCWLLRDGLLRVS